MTRARADAGDGAPPYRFLRCQACGKLFTRIEWDARKFLGSLQCCRDANVQPVLE